MAEEEHRVHELRVRGFASIGEAIAKQEVIARLLCPDEWHQGPCEIPWSLRVTDDPDTRRAAVLVAGVLTTAQRATGLLEPILEAVGPGHTVVLLDGDPGTYEELVEQRRIESA